MGIAAPSTVWAYGDYPRIAREVLAGLGPPLVEACGIGPGQRVLDVAAGTGVASLPAAATGASVVATDLTPELLAEGNAESARRGLEIEWRRADVQDLPFGDGEFDAVISTIGAMFAPDHQRVADEMVRVCRPGGVIGMANWTPDGTIGEFFRLLGTHAPAPASGPVPPTAWGTEEHVRALFGDRVDSIHARERDLPVEHFASVEEYRDYYKTHFGPVIAAYAALETDETAALDRDFLAYAEATNRAAPGERPRFAYEYLQVVATVRRS